MERRTFLTAGGASVLALAAPSTLAADGDGPTAVVREFYDRASETDEVLAFAETVPDLAHSASPLPRLAEDVPRAFDGTLRQTLTRAEVVAEDVDAETVRGFSRFFAASVGDDGIETIAGDNAVVRVTLDTTTPGVGELAKEWLVAPEDGAWRLVWFDEPNGPAAGARRAFRAIRGADSVSALDDPVAEVAHSASPLENVAAYAPWYFRGIRRQELVRARIADRNLGVEAIAGEFAGLTGWASRDELAAVAEDNAVVALRLNDPELDVTGIEQRWLLAPEFGEWRLVWL